MILVFRVTVRRPGARLELLVHLPLLPPLFPQPHLLVPRHLRLLQILLQLPPLLLQLLFRESGSDRHGLTRCLHRGISRLLRGLDYWRWLWPHWWPRQLRFVLLALDEGLYLRHLL